MDRLIPADEYPSASELGVGDYIARQLAGEDRAYASLISAGLACLEAEAGARYERPFAALNEEQQDELLTAVESGIVVAKWSVSPVAFFETLLQLTNEGFYSDPRSLVPRVGGIGLG
jgi:hypothetical protein